MKKIFFFFVVAFCFASVGSVGLASADFIDSTSAPRSVFGGTPRENPILRFQKVKEGIYRGARPEQEGVEYLAKMGVKTILNIESDMEEVVAEQRVAEEHGLRFISIPLSGFWTPDDEDMDRIVSIMKDPANYPLFLHCKHGRDRTGLSVGLYRVFVEKWKPEVAYQEMLDLGFTQELIFLDNYFRDRTGME